MLWTPASKWKTDCYTHIHFKSQVKTWTEFKANLMYQKESKQWFHKLVQILIDFWMFLTPAHKKKYGVGCNQDQRRQWQPTPSLLPWKSHGPRSLVGCSPWSCEESDKTEPLHFHFSLSCTGEGNGNLLQCSRLENPRGGGAWWADIYGVAQSQTRLKRLSSSSNQDILFTLFQCSALCYCLLSYSPFHSISPKKI